MLAFAMTSLKSQSQGWTSAQAVASVIAICAIVAELTMPARAGEPKGRATPRVAAISDWATPMARLGVPPRLPVEIDLHVLLIQSGQAPTTDTAHADDTILVAVPAASPEGVDEDIAQQYGLELLERTELTGLGLRIVQYRNTSLRAISAVLSELRHDKRVRRAQRNAQYTLPNQSAPPAVSSNEKAAPQTPTQHYADPKKAPVRSAQQITPRPVALRPTVAAERPVAAVRAEPPRVGGVGDVLSGGL